MFEAYEFALIKWDAMPLSVHPLFVHRFHKIWYPHNHMTWNERERSKKMLKYADKWEHLVCRNWQNDIWNFATCCLCYSQLCHWSVRRSRFFFIPLFSSFNKCKSQNNRQTCSNIFVMHTQFDQPTEMILCICSMIKKNKMHQTERRKKNRIKLTSNSC